MIVYLAGPMTGVADYRVRFSAEAERLEEDGHTVLNPAMLPLGLPEDRYMPICLSMIDVADAVYFMEGWKNSRGANLEHAYAMYQGKQMWGDD